MRGQHGAAPEPLRLSALAKGAVARDIELEREGLQACRSYATTTSSKLPSGKSQRSIHGISIVYFREVTSPGG